MGSKTTDLVDETDDWWLSQGYASLSPQTVDLTDGEEFKRLMDHTPHLMH
jgi:5'-nucleotidase